MSFGEKIKEIRTSKNMTLEDLSKNTGLSKGYLSKLENGHRGIPKAETLQKIADGLEYPYSQLMYLVGYSPLNPAGMLGRHVKIRRKEKGMSIEKLAESTGIDVEILKEIESGVSTVKKTDIEKIAYAIFANKEEALINYDTLIRYAGYADFNGDFLDPVKEAFTLGSDEKVSDKVIPVTLFLPAHQEDTDKGSIVGFSNNTPDELREKIFDLHELLNMNIKLKYKEKTLTNNELETIKTMLKKLLE